MKNHLITYKISFKVSTKHEVCMYIRHGRILPIQKKSYPKFLLVQNCIKKGLEIYT